MDTFKIYASVSADKGHVRANNEDNIFFNGVYLTPDNRDEGICLSEFPRGDFLLYAVFDGMGGAAFGEEASYIASQVTADFYSHIRDFSEINADELVMNIISCANKKICQKMRQLNSGRMGATLAMVAVYDGKAKVYNVGDSRVYLCRNSSLIQISLDDSFAQRLYRMGIITAEEASVHKERNKLVQHLGIEENEMSIEPHISEEIDLLDGDRILICSDGLSDMVDDAKINEIIHGDLQINEICEELVCEALKNGGRDNISVIIIEAQNKPERPKSEVLRKKSYAKHIAVAIIAVVLALVALVFVCFSYFDLSLLFNKEPPIQSAVDTEPVTVKEISEHQSTILLIEDKGFDMSRIAHQEGFSNPAYSTSDEDIVNISKDGKATGITSGSAVISIEDDNRILEVSVDVVEGGNSAGIEPQEDLKGKNKKN